MSAMLESTLVRNSIKNIHLPLMIFIRMHSQESQFHNKCLFCLIMFIICVQIATFVRTFCKQIQSHEVRSLEADEMSKSSITVCRNMSNDVWNQSLECFKHKSSIMFQPEHSFVFRNAMECRSLSRERARLSSWLLADTWLIPLSFGHTSQLKHQTSF